MNKQLDKGGLQKLLGKRERFEGTYGRIDLEKNKMLVMALTLSGKKKELKEHVWIDIPKDKVDYKKGSKINFTATVMSYRDSFGYLKYGVAHVHALREITDTLKKAISQNKHDAKHAYNRRNGRR